ncbi:MULTISPECIES: hypothetical protein [unclassified Streptomyces]|uniref:hypothetical protein n=1 Tax=unclassified Streptomyces TaxID=2593676 RepID=UPI002E17A393|nr:MULTISPECIES: hypothetical protein [unclassified Streptomyces]
MRPHPRFTAAVVLLLSLPYVAACAQAQGATAEKGGHARVAEKKREHFGADCRIDIDRDLVSATCHNPYPTVDRVALHIECDEWWDIDTDSRPKAVFPAETLRLDGRCWKNVRTAWVSHRKPAR